MAVKLLVERERAIQEFQSASFFKVIGDFIGESKKEFKAELAKDPKDQDEAKKFLDYATDATYKIEKIEVKP